MNHIERRIYPEEQYRQIGMVESWGILLDIHNALQYGFIQNRLPEPGRPIDAEETEAHVFNIEKEWREEKERRDSSDNWAGAPKFSRMPQQAKFYLHSILRDAKIESLKAMKEPVETEAPYNYWPEVVP